MSNANYINLFKELTSTKSPDKQQKRFFAWINAQANAVDLTAEEKVAVYEATGKAKDLNTNKTSARKLEKGERVAFYVRNTELALCTVCSRAIDVGEPVFLELIWSKEKRGVPKEQRKSHAGCAAHLAEGLSARGKQTYGNWLTGGRRKKSPNATPQLQILEEISHDDKSAKNSNEANGGVKPTSEGPVEKADDEMDPFVLALRKKAVF